jgi:TPR repeat protein
MLGLRWPTLSTMVIAALIAAQPTQSAAVSPDGRGQGLGGQASESASKQPTTDSASVGLPTPIAVELQTSAVGHRGSSALPKRQQLCQNVQATAGAPIAREMGPSDLAFLERARALLKSNDIAAARLIFTRLANNGVAEAAFELGRTYDPDFLRTIPVAGLEPDREVAWQWYKRAAALGNADAKSRLAKLKTDTGQ